MVLLVGQQAASGLGEEEERLGPHFWPDLEGSERGVSVTRHEAVPQAGPWPMQMWHQNQLC